MDVVRTTTHTKNYRKGILIVLVSLSFLFNSALQAQDREYHYAFHSLTESEGLSDGINAWIYKDHLGFIWISSLDGLNRFDGVNVRSYKPDPSDTNSLSDNIVTSTFFEDDDGNLWFSTYGAVNVYLRKYDHFESFDLKDEKGEIIAEDYFAFHMDTNERLWLRTGLGSSGRMHWFDIRSKKDSIVMPLSGQRQSVIELSGRPALILSSRFAGAQGLSVTAMDQTDPLHAAAFFTGDDGRPGTNIYNILTDDFPVLWMASDLGLIRFDIETQKTEVFDRFLGEPVGRIKSITRYEDQILTTSEGHGLLNFNMRTRSFESNLVPELNNNFSIRRDDISNVHLDRDGCLWLSYYENGVREGLDYSDLRRYRFPNYRFIDVPSVRPTELAVNSSGEIFVSRGHQLQLVNSDFRTLDEWTFDEKIKFLRTDVHGNVWIVLERDQNRQHGIYTWRPGSDSWILMGRTGVLIEDLHYTSGDRVLLATRQGVHEVDLENKRVERSSAFTELSDYWVFRIFEDDDGQLFFSSNYDRLYIYPDAKEGSRPLAHFTGVGFCHSIHSWKERNKVWMASTMGIAEIALDSFGLTFISGQAHVLPQQKYFKIFVNDEDCWLKTERGLIKFNASDSTLSSYDRVDGVVGVLGAETPSIWDEKGRIWISGMSGINIFHPDSIRPVTAPPTPQIVEIGVNDAPFETALSHGSIDSLVLNYSQNTVSLEFVPCQFGDPKNIRFQYRLIGQDDNWVESRNSGYARYHSLPAGEYTFEARTGNTDGQWSTSPARMSIIVNPPIWATTWAYLLYASVFFGLLWSWRRNEKIKQQRKLELEKQKVEQEKRINEELRKVDRLKDQFLANTSHELRTPLNGIIGLAESLMDGATGQLSDKTKHNLAMIASSGKRLSSLVNDLLDFSKIKSNDLRLKLKAVDLFSAVDIVMTLLNPLRKNSSITMINKVPRDLPRVSADEDRLQQILYNLIGNAIKFTRKGEIVVGAKVDGEVVEVSISDTGIGIPEDQHENIFRSFEQVDGGEGRKFGGTGLGLSVTKQLVELHNGRIRVESKPDKGSTFFFTLAPASADLEVSVPEEADNDLALFTNLTENPDLDGHLEVTQSAACEDNVILIVDDEPVNRQVLENHLKTAGYSSIIARDGEEALQALKNESVALILLDIMMPGLSGFEVCQVVREEHSAIQLPIIMLTAKNRVSDLVEGFALGANDYLTKPFSRDELLARIQTHLSLRKIYSATGKFVPFEFLNAIGHDQITNVSLGDHSLVEVSVLFADIRDFTRISESMSPTENFNFVNNFVGRMGPVIQNHRGFVNQYLGDGIMAIFPTSPQTAIEAAIGMAAKLREYNEELVAEGKEALRMGIGLHSGPLIMGIIGDENRSDPATIADTVNTSSRLEGLTKYYRANIIVSEECLKEYDESERKNFRFLGNVRLKGKAIAIAIYESILGDPPDIARHKLETSELYHAAMANYLAGEFREAHEKFVKLTDKEPGDTVAGFFQEKTQTLLQGDTPPDWEAIEIMTSK